MDEPHVVAGTFSVSFEGGTLPPVEPTTRTTHAEPEPWVVDFSPAPRYCPALRVRAFLANLEAEARNIAPVRVSDVPPGGRESRAATALQDDPRAKTLHPNLI